MTTTQPTHILIADVATQVIESIWPTPPPSSKRAKLLPLRLFVQEVLRRSRTSYVTLQTALYYLTIVQHREWRLSATGTGTGTGVGLDEECGSGASATSAMKTFGAAYQGHYTHRDGIITPPSSQHGSSPATVPDFRHSTTTTTTTTATPYPTAAERMEAATKSLEKQLPVRSRTCTSSIATDPRQCGRRMFLASLVISTKYLQDRAYSNRAWSRVSGLAAGEITRCERKLLEWLDWELHVPRAEFTKWQTELLKRVQAASGNTVVDKTTLALPAVVPSSVTARKVQPSPQAMVAAVKALVSFGGYGSRPVSQSISASISKDTVRRALSVNSNPPPEDCVPMSPGTPKQYGFNCGRPTSYASPGLSPLAGVVRPSDITGKKRMRSTEMCEDNLREVLARKPRIVNPTVVPLTGPTLDQVISGQ